MCIDFFTLIVHRSTLLKTQASGQWVFCRCSGYKTSLRTDYNFGHLRFTVGFVKIRCLEVISIALEASVSLNDNFYSWIIKERYHNMYHSHLKYIIISYEDNEHWKTRLILQNKFSENF